MLKRGDNLGEADKQIREQREPILPKAQGAVGGNKLLPQEIISYQTPNTTLISQ